MYFFNQQKIEPGKRKGLRGTAPLTALLQPEVNPYLAPYPVAGGSPPF
jgi:hypothetical protein